MTDNLYRAALTLAATLAEPMEPLGVKLDDDLPWQEDYRLEYVLPGNRFVYANVMRCVGNKPEPWSACCQVAGTPMFKGWYATAQIARTAVEEHIAAHLEESS